MRQQSILIVNDDLNSRKLFQTYCIRAGYHAWSVGSAEQALAQLTTDHPDLILLDIKLPGMDGMALMRRLKANPVTRDIYIVFTTVYSEHYNQQKVLEAGADGFLIVPAEKEQLMELIANTLSKTLKNGK